MSIPTWLLKPYAEGTRTIRMRTCRRCGAPVLTGLDADMAAFTARADPTPINPVGEAVALLAGRRTYDLIGRGSDRQLALREEHHVQAVRRYPVLPEHRCGQPLTGHSEAARLAARKRLSVKPPF